MISNLPATIDEYIERFDPSIQPLLHELKRTIREAAPGATEKISWGMATFVFHGNLVHFSAEKKHIGFHPSPSGIEAFRKELSDYHCSKGTIQFPYEKPIPFDLVRKIVLFRVSEQASLLEEKKAGKKTETPSRPRYPIPEDIKELLQKEGLTGTYELRPPYQQNGYIGWILQAKRPETRQKRADQMIDELRLEDTYMGRPYRSTKQPPNKNE